MEQVYGGIAETNGFLQRGDQIMSVNDKDLSRVAQDQVCKINIISIFIRIVKKLPLQNNLHPTKDL